MADETPIAWLALEEGTPIYTSDGDQVGKVIDIVADREKDIFSGVTFRRGVLDKPVFLPADRIESLTTDGVRLNISAGDVEALEPFEG